LYSFYPKIGLIPDSFVDSSNFFLMNLL